MGDAQDVIDELRAPAQQLRQAIPEVWRSYADMHRAVPRDGALSAKHKDRIALAIAVTRECDAWIATHARGAARRGATPAETAEALGVAVLLNGGPATVWGPRALEAFSEFAAAASS